MTEWRFIDSGPRTASYNMGLDEAIAVMVRKGSSPPTLRFYGWDRPSVSIGSFQKVSDIDFGYCLTRGMPVVRRPTGGRAILHGDELTYSFSSKNEGFFLGGLLDSYRHLSRAFTAAFRAMGLEITVKSERESGRNLSRSALCFKSTSYGEISLKGRKLVGSAQKRWKDGLLQQGSIPYAVDEENMMRVFNLSSPGLKEAMVGLREASPDLDPEEFKKAIRSSFEEAFGISFRFLGPSREEEHLALELEHRKYLSPQWTLQKD